MNQSSINEPTGGAGPPAPSSKRYWSSWFRLPSTLLGLKDWFGPPGHADEEEIVAHPSHAEATGPMVVAKGHDTNISQEIPSECGGIEGERLLPPLNEPETSLERTSNENLASSFGLSGPITSPSENMSSEATSTPESSMTQSDQAMEDGRGPVTHGSNWGSTRVQTTVLADEEWDIIEEPSIQLNTQNDISTTNLATYSISDLALPQRDSAQIELPQEINPPPQSMTRPDAVQELTRQVTEITRFPVFEGSHSSVYRGRLGSQEVAIKTIRSLKSNPEIQTKLLQRFDIWSRFRHQNILILYGFIRNAEFGRFPAMISAWCENGNAGNFLLKPRRAELRVNLFCDVARGIQYLHGLDPPVIHGDLKPTNVLIDHEGRAKVCDFGLTSLIHEHLEDAMTTIASSTGTTRYLAHELIDSDEDQPPTTASDSYALGCIGLAFLYSIAPFAYIRDNAPRAQFKICREIGSGKLPAKRPNGLAGVSADLWDQFEACWSPEPTSRPSANDICFFLDQRGQEIIDYLTQQSAV